MKGIGPNNLGMSKSSGNYCCGIPDCDHTGSAAKFNDKLESQAMKGNLPKISLKQLWKIKKSLVLH